jgi:hypothetical protein
MLKKAEEEMKGEWPRMVRSRFQRDIVGKKFGGNVAGEEESEKLYPRLVGRVTR